MQIKSRLCLYLNTKKIFSKCIRPLFDLRQSTGFTLQNSGRSHTIIFLKPVHSSLLLWFFLWSSHIFLTHYLPPTLLWSVCWMTGKGRETLKMCLQTVINKPCIVYIDLISLCGPFQSDRWNYSGEDKVNLLSMKDSTSSSYIYVNISYCVSRLSWDDLIFCKQSSQKSDRHLVWQLITSNHLLISPQLLDSGLSIRTKCLKEQLLQQVTCGTFLLLHVLLTIKLAYAIFSMQVKNIAAVTTGWPYFVLWGSWFSID